MIRLRGFISNQVKLALLNYRYIVLMAAGFAVVPYTIWLSMALVALVTLRRGWRDGGTVLIPVMGIYLALLLGSMSSTSAMITVVLTYIPCYLAACVLRFTQSWQSVALLLFLLVMGAALALHWFMPSFITAQYTYLKAMLSTLNTDDAVRQLLSESSTFSQWVLANYTFGLQAASIVCSAFFALTLARQMQSRLFNPGGFKHEMQAFRGERIAFLLLVGLFVAAKQNNVLAINGLPVLMLYFFFAGLSLGFQIFAKRKTLSIVCLLIAPLILVPFVMLPAYVILGSLDSLFNIRLRLLSSAGKTT